LAVEREVKLAFESIEAARRAVIAAGGRLVVSRRLLIDWQFDRPDRHLRDQGCALRLRRDGAQAVLTFKGPVIADGPFKSREEHETTVGSAEVAERIVRALGLLPLFRSEKYREEYDLAGAHLAIDEAPIGVFVEVEGEAEAIDRAAALLGRSPSDYRTESYQRLYYAWCDARGVTPGDMTFDIRN
jgi:adenylate cyclase class 2